MVSIFDLCDQVSRERDAIQAIGQATSTDDVRQCVQSLMGVTAWAISQNSDVQEDWAAREQQFYYLLVEIFGATDETALALSKKMIELLRLVAK